MELWSLILFLGVCLFHLTTADPASHGNYQPIINRGILTNVTITEPIPSDIDLSNRQIKRIEKNALDALTHIKSLNLSNNMLKKFRPSTFSKLINLEELLLANNNITYIYETFVELKNLKRLDLSHNRKLSLSTYELLNVPKSTEVIIMGIRSTELILDFPDNSSIPVTKGEEILEVLQSIFVKPNVTMPGNFKAKLCMTDNGTVKSLEELKQNEPLGDCVEARVEQWSRRIDLSDLGIEKFERGWYKLMIDCYPFIDLSRNRIIEITPELLNDLPVEMVIDLSHNHVNTIKKNTIENKHCVGLFLSSNVLRRIEDGAFKRICLYGLKLDHNDISNLNFISTLPETIEFLGLSHNNISEIPPDIFRGIKKIRAISLTNNNLERIEPGIFDNLEYLSVIELAENRISQLNPEMLKNLSNLGQLDLCGNKIIKITRDAFSEIKSSHRFSLSLAFNEINTIEAGSFSRLNIRTLDLSTNKITDESIANGAFDKTTVQRISLNNNLIINLKGESFSGILGHCDIKLQNNPMRSIKNFPG